MKLIKRKFEFDAGHRVINHESKCKNYHGHRYYGETRFAYKDEKEIGFTIDFGEIKIVANAYFDFAFDHGMILNPKDKEFRLLCEREKSAMYIMSLNGYDEFCNPTAENIVKEMLLALNILFRDIEGVDVHSIELFETPNCSVDVNISDVTLEEEANFNYVNESGILDFKATIDG